MARIISIIHRVKRTIEGEPRPTILVIESDGKKIEHVLATEDDELDWLQGRMPVSWQEIQKDHDLGSVFARHVKWKKITPEEAVDAPVGRVIFDKVKKSYYLMHKVPKEYGGFQAGDIILMILGGSGDCLAFALSNRSKEIGAKVLRVASCHLKDEREKDCEVSLVETIDLLKVKANGDSYLLLDLFKERPELFMVCDKRDRELIRLREFRNNRQVAMEDRVKAEQRLYARHCGSVFLSEDGRYPEGLIKDAFTERKVNDKIVQALQVEENTREAELKVVVRRLDVWQEVFEPIEGCGEIIAAAIIDAIGDIRRFPNKAKLKAYAGVHVWNNDYKNMPKDTIRQASDGSFVRSRRGVRLNSKTQLRQALYLLGDQFKRRPDSVWGQKLREYKVKFRIIHPEPVVVQGAGGKKVIKYSDGHIHKMAMWRTITKFAEKLWVEWTKIEKEKEAKEAVQKS
ncbi:MAG: transposase [Candidatus Falkowbacteria bacterium]|nr:transposase [Candidatus Falkowbacteria bacterium]